MTFTIDHPSPAYLLALEESRQHHRKHKTWSGGLMSRHVERIKALIDRVGAKSVLDYGCGKLVQYHTPAPDGRSVDDYLGVPIFKMDPAMPEDYKVPPMMGRRLPIATALPPGQTWDVTIVTHALGSIPIDDLRDWVMPLLHRVTNKAIFVAENLNDPKKKPFTTTGEKPRGWTAAKWMDFLEIEGGVEVEAWFRGEPGNNPRESESQGPGFRLWPFEE